MNKAQEKLMTDLFERSFKITKTLNYSQVAWILTQVSWGNNLSNIEIKTQLAKRGEIDE